MTLDLSHLLDFQALAETGSFSRAAQARNMTQPGFSRRIRMLEEWVGSQLFLRGISPTSLTDAGRAFEPAAARVLASLMQGRMDARAAAAHGGSALHFAATHVLSFTFFPNWLRNLEGGQPLEAVQLSSDSLGACEDLMREGRAQFLLCHHHTAAPVRLNAALFPSIRVGGDVLLPVSAPNSAGKPQFPLELSVPGRVPLLTYSEASGLGRIIAATFPNFYASAAPNAVFSSHLAAALRSMALMNKGVAWQPKSLVADDIAENRLVRATSSTIDINVGIYIFRSMVRVSKSADQFWARISQM